MAECPKVVEHRTELAVNGSERVPLPPGSGTFGESSWLAIHADPVWCAKEIVARGVLWDVPFGTAGLCKKPSARATVTAANR